jgi:nucleoside-diphosphate-sugar epimerase
VRVLITGTSGFVGGALGKWLRDKGGYSIIGVSRRPPREGAADQSVPCDLSAGIPPCPPAEIIVHCAALSSPWGHPDAFRAHNIQATRNILAFARQSNCSRFVFISSSSICYRHGDQFDISEDDPLPDTPINEYAATKRAAEALVREWGIPYVILRPRAVFGPNDTVLFPRILRAARKRLLPVFVRSDGVRPVGDLIFIDTLSHYIEKAMLSKCSGCYNLTNASAVDLREFINSALERLGYPAPERTMRVETAFAIAGALETASRLALGYWEPPLTRFGVEVMAYSKTFNPAKMQAAFGPPPVSVAEGLDRFVEWQRRRRV